MSENISRREFIRTAAAAAIATLVQANAPNTAESADLGLISQHLQMLHEQALSDQPENHEVLISEMQNGHVTKETVGLEAHTLASNGGSVDLALVRLPKSSTESKNNTTQVQIVRAHTHPGRGLSKHWKELSATRRDYMPWAELNSERRMSIAPSYVDVMGTETRFGSNLGEHFQLVQRVYKAYPKADVFVTNIAIDPIGDWYFGINTPRSKSLVEIDISNVPDNEVFASGESDLDKARLAWAQFVNRSDEPIQVLMKSECYQELIHQYERFGITIEYKIRK